MANFVEYWRTEARERIHPEGGTEGDQVCLWSKGCVRPCGLGGRFTLAAFSGDANYSQTEGSRHPVSQQWCESFIFRDATHQGMESEGRDARIIPGGQDQHNTEIHDDGYMGRRAKFSSLQEKEELEVFFEQRSNTVAKGKRKGHCPQR